MSPDEKSVLSDEMSRLPRSSRTTKVITVGFGILIALGMFYVAAHEWWQVGTELERPVRNFADYLHKHKIASGEPQEVARGTAPPASKVYKMDVDGETIWLCYFNPDDEPQKQALAEIRESGTLKIDGKSRPAKIRETVALAGYDGSRKEAEILQAFASYENR